MSGTYNPLSWYWDVNGIGPHRDTPDQVVPAPTRVYSSAMRAYVPVDDTAYLAWKATTSSSRGVDDPTTQIDTEANLIEVLTPYGVEPTP